jgi:hypothetical protein
MMVTETAYGPALNRYAANPHSTMAEAQPPKGADGLAGPQQTKRESRNEGRTGGIGMPALPAAVAMYRIPRSGSGQGQDPGEGDTLGDLKIRQ